MLSPQVGHHVSDVELGVNTVHLWNACTPRRDASSQLATEDRIGEAVEFVAVVGRLVLGPLVGTELVQNKYRVRGSLGIRERSRPRSQQLVSKRVRSRIVGGVPTSARE